MRIGIAGYGNLGKAVELVAGSAEDVEVFGVFTRREGIKTRFARCYLLDELPLYSADIDVLLLCYGSSSDLPKYTPELTRYFNTVDTFDNHKAIAAHKRNVDSAAKVSGHTSLIAVGWDPGFLSLMRLYFSSFIPNATLNTFWGRGVSQGHSEALRRIPGVIKAIQYTVPKAEALTLASLVGHSLDDADRHKRVCYIAAEKGKEDSIKKRVLAMENYFYGYETEIHFIDDNDPLFDKSTLSHRGRVYALGKSGAYGENKHSAFLDLELSSNPELTAHIAIQSARICHRLYLEGVRGAYDIFDIAPSLFLQLKGENANEWL